ncbi:DUF1127 domain-containing protein [Breoghania sp.]|uniref:DUF1127 domain-containing protein n=1 Tax=Breoghania sp. TaxID=2065378 RepID=UPI00374995CA
MKNIRWIYCKIQARFLWQQRDLTFPDEPGTQGNDRTPEGGGRRRTIAMLTPPSISPGGLAALAARAVRALFAGVSNYNRRRRGQIAAKQLLGWSDHMLADIGLNRADVRCALRDHRKSEASSRLRGMAVERRALALRDAREQLGHAGAHDVPLSSAQPDATGAFLRSDPIDGSSENPDNAQGAKTAALDIGRRAA